jgi:hypothetical protein
MVDPDRYIPSKPKLCMKFVREAMKARLLAAVDAMSLNAVWVLGLFVASLKLHPPIEIHVRSPGLESFRFVNSEYNAGSPISMGIISNVVGLKKAKASGGVSVTLSNTWQCCERHTKIHMCETG